MLLHRIQSHFSSFPEREAICSQTESMTYGQLADRSQALAEAIIRQKLEPGTLVAVVMDRRPAILTAILGIMRAGMAYTIVESGDNQQETRTRLALVQPVLIIADDSNEQLVEESGISWLSSQTALSKKQTPLPLPDGSTTAYVLFTSGSTGRPKGVEISIDNLTHYCEALSEYLALPESLRYGHVSTLAADLGNTSLFLSLWSGGSIYLASESERKDPAAMAQALSEDRIQVLKITPTHWRPILAALSARQLTEPSLEWLLLGGEHLPIELARDSLAPFAARRLVNHYGPTETTIGVTAHLVSSEVLGNTTEKTLPIGRPFGATQALLCDDSGVFIALGETEGELYIGGPSVAKGYRNLPIENEKHFVQLPGRSGRYYRTGDRVRRDKNGNLHFLGRADRQVKINGYRVELEQVEMEANLLPDVVQAVAVLHRDDNHDYLLCGYSGGFNDNAEMRRIMALQVPSYMVPIRFERLTSLPMNANGKMDMVAVKFELVELFNCSRAQASIGPDETRGDRREEDVIQAFKRQLRGVTFTVQDDFFHLGGDSLDAIQLVSGLQLQGYPLTAHNFLAHPTVIGVLHSLEAAAPATAVHRQPNEEATLCAPAQQWFFRQRMPEVNRWTQALALEVGTHLDQSLLAQAFANLLEEHSMLSVRFFREENLHWHFQPGPVDQHAFMKGKENHYLWAERDALVNKSYQALEAQLDIENGQLFRATLLSFQDGPSILLMAAHHLVVDIITWRLLLDDLIRHYAVLNGKEAATESAGSSHFDEWRLHLAAEQDALHTDTAYWQNDPAPVVVGNEVGVEGDSKTVWHVLTEQETQHLEQLTSERWNSTLDRYLLAAYLEEAAALKGQTIVDVDVESHGRLSLREDIDVSRTFGWFTSIFRLSFDLGCVNADTLVQAAHTRLANLPNLGVAYGQILQLTDRATPTLCFNYAGQLRLGLRDDWLLKPASVQLPNLRGIDNSRVHELKLTGRLHKRRLVLDVNFNGKQYTEDEMSAFALRLRSRLLRHMKDASPDARSVLHTTNAAGAIWNPPPELLGREEPSQNARYRRLLLTGATGFIGIHVLQQLLELTSAQIHCLIRPRDGQTAERRLREAWQAFFDPGCLELHRHRIHIHAVNLTEPQLGLGAAAWEDLSCTIDAIYHFAADTKLVGSGKVASRNVLAPVKDCIHLAETGKQKDFHFMSTLAVCGTWPGEQARHFDESCLDIGQQFQNSYEKYKFDAELLVRGFAYRGGNAYVYRSGNVTGHSQTGIFQRNAVDNRWVQCLRGIVSLGQAPRDFSDEIVLSPVDIVAHGLVAISLDETLRGGTFHLDSEHSLSMENIVAVLEQNGATIERIDSPSLGQLFRQSGRLDQQDIAIANFWSARKDRNIRFDHRKTHAHLNRHGIMFGRLGTEWADKFIKHLLNTRTLQFSDAAVEIDAKIPYAPPKPLTNR